MEASIEHDGWHRLHTRNISYYSYYIWEYQALQKRCKNCHIVVKENFAEDKKCYECLWISHLSYKSEKWSGNKGVWNIE